MTIQSRPSRRRFLLAGTATGSGLLVTGLTGDVFADEAPEEEEISPAEDLMREHGVLNRILLIYEEADRRLDGTRDLELATLTGAAGIIRTFIEDYHEKLEEEHLFPLFKKAGKLVGLVEVLSEQHQAGRRLTDRILELATPSALRDSRESGKLRTTIGQFVRMYRPHEAREDTVLFPALRGLMTPKQFDDLGEQFEEHEHELFGEHGFEETVAQVVELEKSLGIHDLSQFTPAL